MPALAALLALSAVSLPAPIQSLLSHDYPGWRLAPSAPQIVDWMRGKNFGQQPNLASADFDRDGNTDYAAEIIHSGRQIAVVFLARGTSFDKFELTRDVPDPYTYILVNRRGSREFDFETLRWKRHQQDSLLVMYFEHSPLLFTWHNGRFDREVTRNDEEE